MPEDTPWAPTLGVGPGQEGKWFAAAKSAKLFDEAIALARRTPCSPQTLTRAARDFREESPSFAMKAGMAAPHWLVEGYGYEPSLDVVRAYADTLQAAENAGCADAAQQRIRDLVAQESFGDRFVTRVLGARLGLTRRAADATPRRSALARFQEGLR